MGTMVHSRQLTPQDIERVESRAATMVAEIIETYAWKRNIPTTPMEKNNIPIVIPTPQHDPTHFSSEDDLSNIKIPVPLKEFIHMPGQREVVSHFIGAGDTFNLSDENPWVFLGKGKENDVLAPFFI
jgi:hypothetical protein